MKIMSTGASASRVLLRGAIAPLACAVAVPWLVLSPATMGGTAMASTSSATQIGAVGGAGTVTAQSSQPTLPVSKAGASATLEQCATATIPQTERAATFAGEMTAMPGAARMEIRIDLEERIPGELLYRTVSAPGLGVWQRSAVGVKVFTHIQQVTNLSAPAFYRGVLRFRWLNVRGRAIKTEELRTARCEQPAPPPGAPTATGTTGTSSTTGSST